MVICKLWRYIKLSKHSDLARDLFLEGYNCSQAVVLAFSDETGLDKETSLRMASPFGLVYPN